MKTIKLITNLFSSGNFAKNQYAADDNLPYHRFNAYDYEKLLNPSDIGQEFVFKNQFNECLKFKLIVSTLGKKTYKTLVNNNFWQKQFCYDQQEMQLELLNHEKQKLIFVLKKFPQFLHQATEDFKYSSHAKFLATIQFQGWNDNNLIVIDYSKPVATMIIKGVFYTKVRTIEIQTTATESLKIYFDAQKGIIGFDDIDGKIWRLDN
jgi:hypothetical protein